jgi:hypothetical protein
MKTIDNQFGFQDAFVEYWKSVVSVFESQDFVLGYELINEVGSGVALFCDRSV